MSDIAIRVENLSKRYRIGMKEEINDTFVGAITSVVKNPMQNLRQLRRLSQFSEGEDDEDVIWALKDVSFEVKEGEVLGIIGRNGAGKSTLLKILSRITHPTSGIVELNGRVASLLEVGTGFHHELTGRENIYLNGTILGMTKQEIDRKLDEIINFSGVEKFIDTPVKRYSSGMRMRLAFSVAAHLDPEILLIDEVLAVGDAEFQKKCLGKMDEVAKGGRTVLFVSHNMGAVEKLCPNTILLDSSKLIFLGQTRKTLEEYLGGKITIKSKFCKVREKYSKAYYKNIRFLNGDEVEITNAISGQPLNIVLDFETTIPNHDLEFAIGVYKPSGEKLLHLGSFYGHLTSQKYDYQGEAICSIPKITLAEGRYFLNLSLRHGSERLDHVIDAITLNVESGDFYGTGKIPEIQENLFLMDHTWHVRGKNESQNG